MKKEIEDQIVGRAKAYADLNRVEREWNYYKMTQTFYVHRNDEGKVECTCVAYLISKEANPGFCCEHILAVKFYLEAKASSVQGSK